MSRDYLGQALQVGDLVCWAANPFQLRSGIITKIKYAVGDDRLPDDQITIKYDGFGEEIYLKNDEFIMISGSIIKLTSELKELYLLKKLGF